MSWYLGILLLVLGIGIGILAAILWVAYIFKDVYR